MLIDMLMIFIIISIVLFILCLYMMEENPTLAIPLIMVNMIFIVIITYGFWNVEYIASYTSGGEFNTTIFSTDEYGDPYSFIFVVFFFIHLLLFFRTGFNLWKEALQTKGEMDYNKKMRIK